MAIFQPDYPASEHPNAAPSKTQDGKKVARHYLEHGKTLYKAYMSKRRKGDLGHAVEAFQKALEIDTQNPSLYLYLAKAMWEQGTISLELAKFYCQTAIQLDRKNWEAYFTLGTFLYQDGQVIDAIRSLRTATYKNFFRSARASIYLGQVLIQQSKEHPKGVAHKSVLKVQGSLEIASGVLRLPLDSGTFYNLLKAAVVDTSIVLVLTGVSCCKLIGLKTLSRKLLGLGSRLSPNDPTLYQLLGDDALFEKREPQRALDYYQQSLSQDPENMSVLSRVSQVHVDLNDRDAARASLEKIIENNPSNVEAQFNLAQISIEDGAFMKSLFHLKECEKLAPHDPYIHSNMAYVLFKLDDLEGALTKYKHALSLGDNPEWMSTVSQTIATISQQVMHDQVQSLDFFQKAVTFHPQNVEAWASLAQLQFEMNLLEEALKSYRQLLEFMPESSECYCNIGYILWQMDRNEQAIDAYEIALQLDPANVVARNNLGVIYLDDNENADVALGLFTQALKDKPSYTMASFNMARAYEMLGKRKEAARAYTQAKALNETFPELSADEIDQHLKRLFY